MEVLTPKQRPGFLLAARQCPQCCHLAFLSWPGCPFITHITITQRRVCRRGGSGELGGARAPSVGRSSKP